MLYGPLSRRYDRSFQSTWKLAVTSLMTVLSTGIPLARKHYQQFENMWPQLALVLDEVLFPKKYVLVTAFKLGLGFCEHLKFGVHLGFDENSL